ncbi:MULTISPECIES: hypothetical protein, partial [unclassified Pseudomonas]|uniref:hypothetical protein n=1 Tax=unclassified Pseudomonas TaxID=196821 RepID=UPI001C498A7C
MASWSFSQLSGLCLSVWATPCLASGDANKQDQGANVIDICRQIAWAVLAWVSSRATGYTSLRG